MKLCSHCDAQFPEDYYQCVHCRRELEPIPTEHAPEPPDLSRLHHLADEHPAKIGALPDSLREAGLPFTLVTDGGTGKVDWYHGSAGRMANASVFVDPADLARAEAIHREFLESVIPHLAGMASSSGTPPDSCPACHDPIARDAGECPSCGLVFLEG